jgi:hypothetical protein
LSSASFSLLAPSALGFSFGSSIKTSSSCLLTWWS